MLPAALASVLALAVIGGGAFWYTGSEARWAESEGLDELEELVEAGQWQAAFDLAFRLSSVIPGNERLDQLWQQSSFVTTISSQPQGATVSRRPYSAPDAEWEPMGVTPLVDVRIPMGLLVMRLELDGYQTIIRAVGGERSSDPRLDPREQPNTFYQQIRPGGFEFVTQDTAPDNMVQTPGASIDLGPDRVELDRFFISRHEVTNREFKAFVDAGGYRDPRYWKYEFRDGDEVLSFAEAVSRFVDRSGRPGPGTWVAGNYPEGQDDYPVGGISWYEAAAFAEFEGAELPTVHHWRRAFASGILSWVLPLSNLNSDSSAPVGQSGGLGWTGTYDMAGNVREWCLNEIEGGRVIVGGSWADPPYTVQQYVEDPGSLPAFSRDPENGVRLAVTRDDRQTASRLAAPVVPSEELTFDGPVSDEVFAAIVNNYSYDPLPLAAEVTERAEQSYWTRERVSFTSSNEERSSLYLYLPHDQPPPYQVVVYWPTIGALLLDSIDQTRFELDFVVRNGRAVAVPILDGTYERRSPQFPDWASNAGKDLVIQQVKDFRRSIDYLDTRTDIDSDAIAYYGFSWGGRLGPIVLATEPRLKAAILNQAGIQHLAIPETNVVNFLPRVGVPVLQFNGRYDTDFRFETSAKPFFELLGTEEKLHIVEDTGHFVSKSTVVGETLDWLDEHLGPVRQMARLPARESASP